MLNFINEKILHKIWDLKLIKKPNFIGTKGEKITIYNFGEINKNSGPDFVNAIAEIDGVRLYGSIEMHVKSSDWDRHKHTQDPSYKSVVLHVVLQDDRSVLNNNFFLPTLEIKNYIDSNHIILNNYKFRNISKILCEQSATKVSSREPFENEIKKSIKNRLDAKANEIFASNKILNYDWNQTIYIYLANSFGLNVNSANFFNLSSIVNLDIIKEEYTDKLNIEALLFGVAGFLPLKYLEEAHSYEESLKKRFLHLSQKYNLQNKYLDRHNWKFLRMRPYSFPTIRIAQLAAVLGNIDEVIESIKEIDLNKFKKNITGEISKYWQHHYDFNKKFKKSINLKIGSSMVNVLIVNFFVPIAYAYSLSREVDSFNIVCNILKSLPPEINSITNKFKKIIKLDSSYESQAIYNLYKSKCSQRKCLDCAVYKAIIKNANRE